MPVSSQLKFCAGVSYRELLCRSRLPLWPVQALCHADTEFWMPPSACIPLTTKYMHIKALSVANHLHSSDFEIWLHKERNDKNCFENSVQSLTSSENCNTLHFAVLQMMS